MSVNRHRPDGEKRRQRRAACRRQGNLVVSKTFVQETGEPRCQKPRRTPGGEDTPIDPDTDNSTEQRRDGRRIDRDNSPIGEADGSETEHPSALNATLLT